MPTYITYQSVFGRISDHCSATLCCQEAVIDLNGLNEIPAVNEAGAAFLPEFNMFANNLTLWDLNVSDVQLGGSSSVVQRAGIIPPIKDLFLGSKSPFLCHKNTAKARKTL